jgi:hypothetical protein
MGTEFFWAWRGYAPTPDRDMTRGRMARMMRAWRAGGFTVRRVESAPVSQSAQYDPLGSRAPGRRRCGKTDHPAPGGAPAKWGRDDDDHVVT